MKPYHAPQFYIVTESFREPFATNDIHRIALATLRVSQVAVIKEGVGWQVVVTSPRGDDRQLLFGYLETEEEAWMRLLEHCVQKSRSGDGCDIESLGDLMGTISYNSTDPHVIEETCQCILLLARAQRDFQDEESG